MENPKLNASTAPKLLRLLLPLAAMGLCFWLIQSMITLPSLTDVTDALLTVPLFNWIGALFATGVSFWALGRYDGIAHRHLQTGLDSPRARAAGMAAIAFSQTVGFGIVTGAFARWRLLPGLSPARAAQMTALTGLTFMAALAGLCGLTLLVLMPFSTFGWLGLPLLLGCAITVTASFVWPVLSIRSVTLRWPSLFALSGLSLWAFIDITAAGVALWLLCPAESGVTLQMVLPAYFIALGFAVVSSAPGGTGPLELGLITLIPTQDPALLVSGIVGFRLIYYAVPAALAGITLMWPALLDILSTRSSIRAAHVSRYDPAHTLPMTRPRAETGVIRQNGGHLQTLGESQLALLDTPQASVALFDPVSAATRETFTHFKNYARGRNAAACFYKCSPQTAILARQSGWKLLRIAAEAVINPLTFDESGSSKRQLRRKLRNAEKADIQVRHAAETLPLDQLAQVDARWCETHGHALGTTMGQFERNYIKGQEVFVAWQGKTIIGFASFHVSDSEWCLDLIRMGADAPDGTGHALMRAAIVAAADKNIPRLSLAAVPDHKFADRVERGLRRFKTCFTPVWEPQYIAAPTWPQMALCLADLLRLVHRPAPLKSALPWTPSDQHIDMTNVATNKLHNEDEQNEIVIAKRA